MNRSRTLYEAPERGLLVILTAPSGTGKTTVAREVLVAEPRLAFSISHTTRSPRADETDGVQYHFLGDADFDRMVREGAFAEWAWVHENRYGTCHAEIERLWSKGRDALFDIDPQGGKVLMAAYPAAVTIFMVPPSMATLRERLRGRRTERDAQLHVRLADAAGEIAQAVHYQYIIINGTVAEAVADFRAILRAERCRVSRRCDFLVRLADEARDADDHPDKPTREEPQ